MLNELITGEAPGPLDVSMELLEFRRIFGVSLLLAGE